MDYGDWMEHGMDGGDPDDMWPLVDDDELEQPQA